MSLSASLRDLVAAVRCAMTPSVDNVLANATKEIERLHEVAEAQREKATRLYDLSGQLFHKSHHADKEAARARRIANRFAELID